MDTTWTSEVITEKLKENPVWVERGLVAIFKLQTGDEQATEQTRWRNGKGFSAFHAQLGSYYARWVMDGKHLTGKHLDKGRSIIIHYSKQLAQIANHI
jgi:hypothetical protein